MSYKGFDPLNPSTFPYNEERNAFLMQGFSERQINQYANNSATRMYYAYSSSSSNGSSSRKSSGGNGFRSGEFNSLGIFHC
jgi:hypothetical protein